MAWIAPITNHDNSYKPAPADFNRMEGDIQQLYDDTVAGKNTIAVAIVAMGQVTAVGSMTYAQLAALIQAIDDGVDAGLGDVLAGKKIFRDNALKTGTMPNNAGDVAAISFHVAGTSLHIVPARGFTDGVDDAVIIDDPDFLSAYFREDVNMFGKQGSLHVIVAQETVCLGQDTIAGGKIRLLPPAGLYDGVNNLVTVTDPDFVASKLLAGYTYFGLAGGINNYIGVSTPISGATAIDSISAGDTTGYGIYKRVRFKPNFAGCVDGASEITLEIYGIDPSVVKAGTRIGGDNVYDLGTYTTSPIKSLQAGMISSASYPDVTVASVDMTKTVVLVTKNDDSGNSYWDKSVGFGYMLNPTTVRFMGSGTIYYQVIEFNGVKSLNRGEVGFTGTSPVDVTIPAVDLSKTVVFVQQRINESQGASLTSGYVGVRAYMLNSTTLRLAVPGRPYNGCYYHVVEFI